MSTALQSAISYLSAHCPHEDLLSRFLAHAENMEVQVNMDPTGGVPHPTKKTSWITEDGLEEWHNYRIPRDAATEPHFKDYPLRFDLSTKVLGIGSTGWDWVEKRSRWVGFDFDSVANHGGGLQPEELQRIREAVANLDYVEVRRSTSGTGIHLYVLVDVPTQNHTEHAALARYILGCLCRDAGVDLRATVDICGGNMWLFHRKMTAENQGLALIKPATRPFTEVEGWEAHIDVVRERRHTVKIKGLDNEEEEKFNDLASAHRRVPLDAKHKEIIAGLDSSGYATTWVTDHHLLQTHTKAFDKVYKTQDIIGPYDTQSEGTRASDINCFAFPLDNGAWKIVRFGGPQPEKDTWVRGEKNTWCLFNTSPPLEVAAKLHGGVKLSQGEYNFDNVQSAQAAYNMATNGKVQLTDCSGNVKLIDGAKGIQIEVERINQEDKCPEGFVPSAESSSFVQNLPKGGNIILDHTAEDGKIRRQQTSDGESQGWVLLNDDGKWGGVALSEVGMALQSMGKKRNEVPLIIGSLTLQPWTIVTKPFQSEYPGGRQWNKSAPQWVYQPADRSDTLTHPHWDLVLNHIGADLDKYIKDLSWAAASGICTGGDYFRAIYASILREPYEPTPYIFLFGPENGGKSMVHEAFELLVTSGVVKADRSLTNQSDFNGELAKAIICVVEEKDIGRTPGAHNKIKEAVTARQLSIRRMRTDSYMIPNITHWFQCANKADNCPVFPGDTRITMVHVGEVRSEVPKSLLIQRLVEEAPAFMRTLVDMELPTATGRLRIPVVNTEHKSRAAEAQRSLLDVWMRECLEFGDDKPGIPFTDLYKMFVEWLPLEERGNWSRLKVSRQLPSKYATEKRAGNVVCVPYCELKKQQ